MIKAFIFDLGNVIVPFDHNKIVESLQRFCEHQSEEIFAKAISSPLVQKYNLGKITSAEFFEALTREFKWKMDYEEFSRIWNCTFALEPLISEQTIKRLAEKYRLILLSDTNELHFDFIREKFPILNYFDEFVLSHKVNVVKPSPEIFRIAVEKADCLPAECIFVDDLKTNIEGAKKCGIAAIQFVSAKQFEDDLKKRNLV